MARTPTFPLTFLATLTEASATGFANLTIPVSAVAGGYITYTVQANDATNFQALNGFDTFAIVNKAGTLTLTLGTDTQVSAVSSGTLTGTLSLVDAGSNVATFKMSATSSLTQTNLVIRAEVYLDY